MTDVKMPEFTPCQFDARGWAPCNKPSDNGWCSEHEGLKCSSCDAQAVIGCDAQIGGLGCGAPLCGTCKHGGPDGNHITEKVYDEVLKKERDEKKARIASRTSSVQRMNEELGVPATLFELLKGGSQKEGYELKNVYFLELKHGLMGFFPAIFSSDDERVVVTTGLQLLERVWRMLEFRDAKLRGEMAYVNEKLSIAYFVADRPEECENREPFRILTNAEIESLTETEEKPFCWASGLLQGYTPSMYNFLYSLTKQASKFDPTFESAFKSAVA